MVLGRELVQLQSAAPTQQQGYIVLREAQKLMMSEECGAR